MLGFLKHLLQNQNAAEDLLHDTFLRLFEGRGKWQAKSNPKAWLFTVAYRLAMDKIRTSKRHRELTGTPEARAVMGAVFPPDSLVDRRDLENRIERVLSTLTPAHATAFHLRIGQEFTYGEMASICDEPQGTLRSRVHHVLNLLRRELAEKS